MDILISCQEVSSLEMLRSTPMRELKSRHRAIYRGGKVITPSKYGSWSLCLTATARVTFTKL